MADNENFNSKFELLYARIILLGSVTFGISLVIFGGLFMFWLPPQDLRGWIARMTIFGGMFLAVVVIPALLSAYVIRSERSRTKSSKKCD